MPMDPLAKEPSDDSAAAVSEPPDMDRAEATASDETKTEPIEDDELELISQQMLAAAEKAVDEDPIPETAEPSAEVVESKALESVEAFRAQLAGLQN